MEEIRHRLASGQGMEVTCAVRMLTAAVIAFPTTEKQCNSFDNAAIVDLAPGKQYNSFDTAAPC